MSWWPWHRRRAPLDDRRWVVLDVESSGLDADRDRLLAIAALALSVSDDGRPAIDLGDTFEVVLRQAAVEVDRPNILLHGIGVGAQRAGMDPREGLAAFAAWVGAAPLIAFHAAFDETMIRRAVHANALPSWTNPWVDLAQVAEVVRPDVRAKSLDEWLEAFGIAVAVRHQAAADALATAELLQQLWPSIVAQHPASGFQGLVDLAAQRRWLQRS